jgi:hypothetical protein
LRALNAASHERCGDLRISDLADVLADALRNSERRVVEHMHRLHRLHQEEEKKREATLH